MSLMDAINVSARTVQSLLPWTTRRSNKHDYREDFGFPDHVSFDDLYTMYSRVSLASGAVRRVVSKTWQDRPSFRHTEEQKMNEAELGLKNKLRKIRFWPTIAEADRRAMVGGFSFIVMRFADGKSLEQPAEGLNGLDSLVSMTVFWANQIEVKQWDEDPNSLTYGEPKMFLVREWDHNSRHRAIVRSVSVHPSRVIVWSSDGTVHAESPLKPVYDDLLTASKVVGAGGEGFWKNAKSSLVLEMDKEANALEMAAAMGVDVDGLADKMDEQVQSWQRGFDVQLFLQGIQAKSLPVRLPSPEHFFMITLMSLSSHFMMPHKVLVGTQTGERASTEDAKDWNYTVMSRRSDEVVPNLEKLLDRWVDMGIILRVEWDVKWTDLTESTVAEKADRIHKMADSNQKAGTNVFTVAEMRAVLGLETQELDETPGSRGITGAGGTIGDSPPDLQEPPDGQDDRQ